jgi:hypothetical protein
MSAEAYIFAYSDSADVKRGLFSEHGCRVCVHGHLTGSIRFKPAGFLFSVDRRSD